MINLYQLIFLTTLLWLPLQTHALDSSSEKLDIFEDVKQHAKNVITGESTQFAEKQTELTLKLNELDAHWGTDDRFKHEVTFLKDSLTEIEKVKLLSVSIGKNLSPEELMKLYFEMKALELIKKDSAALQSK